MVAAQAFCVSVYARPQCSRVCKCEYVIDSICARMCVQFFWQLYVIIVYMRGITLYSGVRLVQGGGERPVGCLQSWHTFNKRATNHRAPLQKRAYQHTAFHESSQPYRIEYSAFTRKSLSANEPLFIRLFCRKGLEPIKIRYPINLRTLQNAFSSHTLFINEPLIVGRVCGKLELCVWVASCCRMAKTHIGWQTLAGCLVFIGYFPQKRTSS